jgi:hypothetical protein
VPEGLNLVGVLPIHGCRKGHDGVRIERFHAEFSSGDVSSVDTRLQKSCAKFRRSNGERRKCSFSRMDNLSQSRHWVLMNDNQH